jgi:cytochrome c oxidase subunit 2
MTSAFSFIPEQASTLAPRVDALLLAVTGMTALVAFGVVVVMFFFLVKYRRGHEADRTLASPQNRQRVQQRIELVWIFVPMALFVVVFAWGAELYFEHYAAPADAQPIFVVARQWMWKLEHPSGRREINELHVARGTAVKLIMTSQDVIHSFFVPAFRIKQDVLPGRYTSLWFRARESGEFHLFCAEYCGTDHAHMGGRIVVMEPAEYARWLNAGEVSLSMAQRGEALFRQLGCSGCHGANAAVHAPKLEGLFGKPVPLASGGVTIADERYIRDSILDPAKEVAAGYAPIMPSFAGQVSDEQILDLIAYIESVSAQERTAP